MRRSRNAFRVIIPYGAIKARADSVLSAINTKFDAIYSDDGPPSIAQQRLLKASPFIALRLIRSEPLFCQMLDYNMQFRQFLAMNSGERTF